ncbi:MAG: amylo-alpha-1,6-glucosidase [Caldilineales bacterium]|nr:amylo-alpha-1,6-glucosidase [Caldilineales bacterium]MCW5881834.1 amylo-alpha-1,6-glucosidase [Anaerolineae bacterium]
MVVDFGRETCGDLNAAERREWLATNGIGGYASGTVAGLPARRYHGLLVAALQPPLGRTVLLSKLDETATYLGRAYPLFANRWAGGAVEPAGYQHLERFRLEGTTPVWSFACADALLEKRVWMQPSANTTYIRYDLHRASAPLTLSIKALVNYRDHHALTRAGDWQMDIQPAPHGLRVTAFPGATPLYLLSAGAAARAEHQWYRDYFLAQEASRGQDTLDDALYAGAFTAQLEPGASLTLVASVEPDPNLDGQKAYQVRRDHEQGLLQRAELPAPPPWIEQLVLAADQFIVRRPAADGGPGHSVIAGYHWFGDWGRDTMISLPGLTLATGRPEIAASILRTFARYVDRGMLPNRFPDAGETPEYNTVDATLWYFEAIRAYHAATGDDGLLRDLFPVLQEIIVWHQRGTRYNIHVDAADGLLYAGEPGVQLTWMDAKVGDWVVTPRTGKPVEINALWYNALRSMADFARRLARPSATYDALAQRAGSGFARFWNPATGYCHDLLDGPAGDDPALRPNQLLAVSLPHSPLPPEHQAAVVAVCGRQLLTSHGLRSLAPNDPAFVGHYGGDVRQRDGAYHQGTVWGWLIGPFVMAHLRVHRDPAAARAFLAPFAHHLADHGLGSVSEIFDGDPPFTPRGCIAQAWSVAEVLRAWQATGSPLIIT